MTIWSSELFRGDRTRRYSNGALPGGENRAKKKSLFGMPSFPNAAGGMKPATTWQQPRSDQIWMIATIFKPGWICTTLRKAERRGDNSVPVGRERLRSFAARALAFTAVVLMAIAPTSRAGSSADDEKAVAALDTEYQAAVKANDVATMDRILADDFVLVTGLGKIYTKRDLLEQARGKRVVYEHQEDSAQKVRVWGETAVVTALLWAKGTEDGKAFDYKLWFSDTYVRTPGGWRYVFGQASTRLPTTP
jgi:ketosteroid isomerase-like protein